MSSYSLREIVEPRATVEFLRLRHQVYFRDCRYGPEHPLEIDFSAYDACSRLYGIHEGERLVGGFRIIFREPQPVADVVRALSALANTQGLARNGALPAEEAFDLRSLGPLAKLVDCEVGRLTSMRGAIPPWVVVSSLVGTLALLLAHRARLYVYTTAQRRGPRIARISRPRWLFAAQADGVASEGFRFPEATTVAVCAAEDSPCFELALQLVEELDRSGSIALSPELLANLPSARHGVES